MGYLLKPTDHLSRGINHPLKPIDCLYIPFNYVLIPRSCLLTRLVYPERIKLLYPLLKACPFSVFPALATLASLIRVLALKSILLPNSALIHTRVSAGFDSSKQSKYDEGRAEEEEVKEERGRRGGGEGEERRRRGGGMEEEQEKNPVRK